MNPPRPLSIAELHGIEVQLQRAQSSPNADLYVGVWAFAREDVPRLIATIRALLSDETMTHMRQQYDLRYEDLSEDSYAFAERCNAVNNPEAHMSITEKHERSLSAARAAVEHYLATGKRVHYSDAVRARDAAR